MRVCICLCACVCVCMSLSVCVCACVCVCICLCACVCVCTSLCVPVCTFVRVCTSEEINGHTHSHQLSLTVLTYIFVNNTLDHCNTNSRPVIIAITNAAIDLSL